jgi:hypothetical protein
MLKLCLLMAAILDGGQVFFPRDKDPFIALLALPGDDIKPENFVAFYSTHCAGTRV